MISKAMKTTTFKIAILILGVLAVIIALVSESTTTL